MTVVVRRRLEASATALAVLLLPSPAWALPGPEVLVPMVAVLANLLLVMVWLGRRLRAVHGWVAFLFALGVVVYTFEGLGAAAVVVAFAAAVKTAKPSVRAALCACAVTVAAAAHPAMPLHQEARPEGAFVPFGLPPPPVGPFPRAAVPILREGPSHVIHVGEPEDFALCRVPGGGLLRPAELAAVAPALDGLTEPTVLLVAANWDPTEIAAAVDGLERVHVVPFGDAFPMPAETGASCYEPPLLRAVERYVPRGVRLFDVPPPAVQLPQLPWLRPLDLAHWLAAGGDVQVLDAERVVRMPRSQMGAWVDVPVVLVGQDLRHVTAAARLLRDTGAAPVAITRGVAPSPRRATELTTARLGVASFGAALVVLLIGLLGRLLAWRAAAAHAWGRAPGWLGPSVHLVAPPLALVACGASAWWLDGHAVPRSLVGWATPAAVGGEALVVGLVAFGMLTVALWARVAGLRGWAQAVAAALVTVLLLATAHRVLQGSGPSAIVVAAAGAGLLCGWLAEASLLRLARFRQRRLAGRRPGWALLDVLEDDDAAGRKAGQLALRRRQGWPVPPGVVVWTHPRGEAPSSALRAVRVWLGKGRLIVRSAAAEEDKEHETAAGRFRSEACAAAADLAAVIRRVASQYEDSPDRRPAVLVMPWVASRQSGVAQAPVKGTQAVLVEHAAAHAAVTGGHGGARRYWGRQSRRWLDGGAISSELQALGRVLALCGHEPRYLEWLARGRDVWLVQERAVPAGLAAASPSPLGELLAVVEKPYDPASPWLRRVGVDDLPPLASPRTARLWAQCWRRDDALGDAFVLLGLPRRLAPRQAVVAAWGAPWTVVPAAVLMQRVVQLRVAVAAAVPGRSTERVASMLARRAAGVPRSFREAVTHSIMLRLLQPLLEPEAGRAPPAGPTVLLAQALQAAGDPARLPERWWHRAPWDLDPASPRYGELAAADWQPPEQPPERPVASAPDVLDQRWCAWVRDGLHDRLAWEAARVRAADSGWDDAKPYAGPHPTADVLSLMGAEAIGVPTLQPAADRKGTWVSGQGPLEGEAERDPSRPGPGRILIVDTPTPERAAYFAGFAAVVAARGGALSHGALVARELAVPALFGVGAAALEGAGRLVLEADGGVTWLELR